MPRRFPAATTVVWVVTACLAVAQTIEPDVLESLRRNPSALHSGQWWRLVTPLFVQSDGWAQIAANLLALAVIGVFAERAFGAWRWLVVYFGAGIITEVFGYLWEPTGAGNSIAVCGLAGGIALAHLRGRPVPAFAGVLATTYWTAALLGFRLGSVAGDTGSALTAVVLAAAGAAAMRLRDRRVVGLGVPAAGLILTVLTDIHGIGLLAGVLLAAAVTPPAWGKAQEKR